MLLTRRGAAVSILYGVVVMAFKSSTPFCEGKFQQHNSFAMKGRAPNGLPTTAESFLGDDAAKVKSTYPAPEYPTHISIATTRALSVDTAGGGRKAPTKHDPTAVWKELAPMLAVWYVNNVVFGILTKSLLMDAYYPWTIATIQMICGILFQLPMWYFGKRSIPELHQDNIKSLILLALCQFAIHAGATIATGISKGLALAHVIKALEPICTMGVDHVLSQREIPVEHFLGVIPVVAGSILPFWKHLSFDLLSMIAVVIVVVSSSTRVVLCRKILLESKSGKKLDASNLFAILSAMSSVMFIPVALCLDGFGFFGALKEKSQAESVVGLLGSLCLSGFLYYIFNVASFELMEKVTPVSHAVANLMRRPVVMLLLGFLDSLYQIARNIPVKWIPLSFLFWSKAIRDSHSLADLFNRTCFSTVMAHVPTPSMDSIISSSLALGGCLIYAKEVNGGFENIFPQKKTSKGKRSKTRGLRVAQ